MKVLELFCGTKSISNAFAARGHEVYTVDWEKGFEPTLCVDIGTLTAAQIIELCGGVPDVIWASPDCTTYSVAAISYHRKREANGNLKAVTDYAKQCDRINEHVVDLIHELHPRYWFIENPRGAMRKMDFMQPLPRYTVTYCKYGETRMKPTDMMFVCCVFAVFMLLLYQYCGISQPSKLHKFSLPCLSVSLRLWDNED